MTPGELCADTEGITHSIPVSLWSCGTCVVMLRIWELIFTSAPPTPVHPMQSYCLEMSSKAITPYPNPAGVNGKYLESFLTVAGSGEPLTTVPVRLDPFDGIESSR